MKAALALLLALALVPPVAFAQDPQLPPPEAAAGSAAAQSPSGAVFDGRAYWARFDNSCLAGGGGVLAMGAISAGVWWGRRRAERNRLKRQLNSPSLALQTRTGGVGLLVRGRF